MLMRIDTILFNFVNHTCSNALFDVVMPVLTWLAHGVFLALIALLMMIGAAGRRKIYGILLLGGITASFYISSFLKHVIGRPRPFTVVPGARAMAVEDSFSFPSTHAVMAFMAAFILARCFKKPVLFFALAALVAFSRVYIGVHFVSDVLAGAAIGALIGWLLVKVSKNADASA